MNTLNTGMVRAYAIARLNRLTEDTHMLTRAMLFVFLTLTSTAAALAQVGAAPKSTGPSGNQLMGDFSAWFQNHQGAGIALVLAVVLTVGYIVYGLIKPKSDKS